MERYIRLFYRLLPYTFCYIATTTASIFLTNPQNSPRAARKVYLCDYPCSSVALRSASSSIRLHHPRSISSGNLALPSFLLRLCLKRYSHRPTPPCLLNKCMLRTASGPVRQMLLPNRYSILDTPLGRTHPRHHFHLAKLSVPEISPKLKTQRFLYSWI